MFHGRSSDSAGSFLLARLPRLAPSVMLAFVPAYRCGAVPEFHRIPFSPSIAGETVEDPLYPGAQ